MYLKYTNKFSIENVGFLKDKIQHNRHVLNFSISVYEIATIYYVCGLFFGR